MSSSSENDSRNNFKSFLPHNLCKSSSSTCNNNKASCPSSNLSLREQIYQVFSPENLEPSRAGQSCLFQFLPHEVHNRSRLSEAATSAFVPSSSADGVVGAPGGGGYGRRDILSGRQRSIENEFFEFCDPHRDMRLDVDNMSYEELLALEEKIGNVSSGLTICGQTGIAGLDVDNMSYEELLDLEERIGNVSCGLNKSFIRGSIRQRKYKANRASLNLEPCSICWEGYVDGVDVGKTDCGHEFHTGCIQHWLTLKNICPICKMTAIET